MVVTPEQLAKDTERSHQVALFAWAALNVPDYPDLKWLYAIPNANSHHQYPEGVRAGVPDVHLPVPIRTASNIYYPGLYIEVKLPGRQTEGKNGGCSDDQVKWINRLNEIGYVAVVCYGWEEARDNILYYLRSAKLEL